MSGRRLLSSSWPAFLTLVARWEGPRRSQDGSMTGRLAPPPEARPVDENEPLIVGACRRIISSISPPPRPAPYRRPRAAEAALRARLLAQLEYEDLQRARELADAGLREQALTFLVERATRLQ